MKKIFLTLVLIFSLILPASATEFTININATVVSTDFWESRLVSDEADPSNDVEEFHLKPAPYTFNRISDALSFANNPATYLGLTSLDASDPTSFPEIEMTLETADSTAASIIGAQEITMSNYGAVTNLTITPATSGMKLYSPSGSRLFVIDNAEVTFNNLTFEGNNAAGGVSITGGTANFNSVTFQNIDMSGSNGGAANITGGTATFTGCTFDTNTADNGGSIYITGGTVNFDGTTAFKNNPANSSGGAIAMTGGTLSVGSDTTFTSNTAGTNGGALAITGGTVTLASGITFSGNTATTSGGAILLNSSSTTLALSEITFSGGNSATDGYGGAILVGTTGGTLNLSGCTFEQNTAGAGGGAVAITGGTSTFSGNSFSNNTTTAEGGAVYLSGATSSPSVTFSDTNIFASNTAGTNGGAVFLANLNAALGGSLTFRNNTAATNGGAVYVGDSGTATFTDTAVFNSNSATNDSGGAIYVSSSGSLSAGGATLTFTGNTASKSSYDAGTTDPTLSTSADRTLPDTGYGGAICFTGSASTLGSATFSNNIAPVGGAVALTGSGSISVSSSSSFGTNSAWTGGAVYIGAGSVAFAGSAAFETNKAQDEGGAIFAASGASFKISTSATFTENQANADNLNFGNGGAIYWSGTGPALSTALTSSSGVTFKNNSTGGTSTVIDNNSAHGGAIYFAGTGIFTINSSTNLTFEGNSAYNSGGAIASNTGSITIESVTVSDANTAPNNYGGFVYSASGTVTLTSATISSQSANNGGAVAAYTVAIDTSTLTSNTASTSGGAVYVLTGGLTVNTSTFTSNKASHNGGALYGEGKSGNNDADVTVITIQDSLFTSNNAANNGGAISLTNNCKTTITTSTFESNTGNFGGSINAYGTMRIETSYFTGNNASMWGGAVYFDQSGSGKGIFDVEQSMFSNNTTGGGGSSGGQGGALYLKVDHASILSCTFDSNASTSGSNVRGGAVYLDTSGSVTTDTNWIDNSTFVGNRAINGTTESTGGAVYADGSLRIRSSTFTLNNVASTKGGGLHIASSGSFTISGTLFVGNSATLGSDVWSDGTWTSMGYNRVGIYGTGSANASWIANPVPESDKENIAWTTATFYSDNILDDNVVETDDTKPPYIGSSLATEQRLQTIMLSEDANLAETDRATNIIPYNLRFQFPEFDERGVQRRVVVSGTGVPLDIGPVRFGGIWNPSTPPTNPYTIAYIQISGVPNSIRRIGQTASLIAKIYYTNGRTAYGGTGDNYEAIKWSATPTGYLKVSDNGVITAMRLTTGESYVTLKCETVRTDTSGNPATAIARIKIDPALEYGDLNTSPESGNTDTVQIIRDLIYEFEEYNMGYMLTDKNPLDLVQSYNFEDIIVTIFGVDEAYAIATTASNYSVTTSSSNALSYVVNVEDVKAGAVTPPITYLCSFTGNELKTIFGTNYNSIFAAQTSLASDNALDAATVAEIFKVLNVDFQNANGSSISILNSVNISDAVNKGALEVTNNGQGIDIKLNLMLANVAASNTEKLEITESDNSDLKGAIIIPDGINDDKISGSIIFPQKEISTAQENTETTENQTQNQNQTSEPQTTAADNNNKGSSSGSGGSCNFIRGNVFLLFLVIFSLAFVKIKRR